MVPAGDVADFFAAHKDSILYQQTDVTDWESQKRLFEAGHSRFGGYQFVSANAGIGESCDILANNLDKPFLKTVDVNLTGVLLTCKLAAYYFRLNGTSGGSLILTASSGGFAAADGMPAYVATKHGLFGLLRSFAMSADLINANIAVSAVAPGLTATRIMSPTNKDPKDPAFQKEAVFQVAQEFGIPVQSPVEPARTIAWLAAQGMDALGMAVHTVEGLSVDVEKGACCCRSAMVSHANPQASPRRDHFGRARNARPS
jgi:NAD(P)-dependent dehydrogenase (short-subunit alcohol dehydrogenase family)